MLARLYVQYFVFFLLTNSAKIWSVSCILGPNFGLVVILNPLFLYAGFVNRWLGLSCRIYLGLLLITNLLFHVTTDLLCLTFKFAYTWNVVNHNKLHSAGGCLEINWWKMNRSITKHICCREANHFGDRCLPQ